MVFQLGGRAAPVTVCLDNVSLLDGGSAVPTAWWQLRDEHSAGEAQYSFGYGQRECTPVVGDWDGDGKTTIGVACASGGQWAWSLRNGLAAAAPAVPTFSFGAAACRPPLRFQPHRMKGTP